MTLFHLPVILSELSLLRDLSFGLTISQCLREKYIIYDVFPFDNQKNDKNVVGGRKKKRRREEESGREGRCSVSLPFSSLYLFFSQHLIATQSAKLMGSLLRLRHKILLV